MEEQKAGLDDSIYFIYLFIIGFIYRPYVLTPRCGRQVRESGTLRPLLRFLDAPQIVHLLSNFKSAA